MATAQTLIEGALRNLRVTKRGFTAASEDLNEGLEALNQLLNSLSAGGYLVPYRTRETFTPLASQSSYTIGVDGDFNTVRPVAVEAVTVQVAGLDYYVNLYGVKEYNLISLKTIVSIPDNAYYEASYPLGKLYFDFQPDTAYTIILDSLKPLTAFATLGTAVSLPEGYERGLKYLLAEELADEYDKPITPSLAAKIADSKDMMLTTTMSYRKKLAHVDAALLSAGGYNILKGE